MAANRENISVVLCGVRESGNVGSVCRAMKTMGFHSLVLADCPAHDEDKVRMLAVHAYDIYENAVRCATLSEALVKSSLSAGFTRRKGEKRKDSSLSLRDFVTKTIGPAGGFVSLVFGNEKNGLSDEELACCSLAVHIPTSDDFPSLNVAQAVQIACYEFFSADLPGEKKGAAPAGRPAIDAEVSGIVDSLLEAGFFRKSNDMHARRFLRDLCERAYLGEAEISYLGKIFRKAAALASRPSPRGRQKGGTAAGENDH